MIEAKKLRMYYGRTLALCDASFRVEKGEILGLLGPNGAGKTTAMNILATHIIPTSGTATVGGEDIMESPLKVKSMLGYLPEEPPLYKDMEVAEYLKFVGKARRLFGKKLEERIEWAVNACALKPIFRKPIRELSRGYKQRTGLAQALLHDPQVLILDEPTSGLDPLQIIEIRKLIRDLAREKTVVFSTHIMQEAAAITDHIVIINQGRIIADSTTAELKDGYKGDHSLFVAARAASGDMESALKEISSVTHLENVGKICGAPRFDVRVKDLERGREEIASLLSEKKWETLELADKDVSLEDVFIELVEKSRRGNLTAAAENEREPISSEVK